MTGDSAESLLGGAKRIGALALRAARLASEGKPDGANAFRRARRALVAQRDAIAAHLDNYNQKILALEPDQQGGARQRESRLRQAHVLISQTLRVIDELDALGPATSSPTRKKPGPRPVMREALAATMLQDLQSGRFTAEALDALDRDALAETYGAKQGTARRARDEALAKFGQIKSERSGTA